MLRTQTADNLINKRMLIRYSFFFVSFFFFLSLSLTLAHETPLWVTTLQRCLAVPILEGEGPFFTSRYQAAILLLVAFPVEFPG